MKKSIRIVWFFSLALFLLNGCSEINKNTDEEIAGFELSKNIIYVENDQCEEVALFYHEMLGIPYKKHAEDFTWVEFETGSCKLCIHHNNKGMEMPLNGISHIVFYLDNQDQVTSLYEKFIYSRYTMKEIGKTDKVLKPQEISQLIPWNTPNGQSISSFWVSDPVGNIVQIEPAHEE